jgi:23S rRNA pseudouridine1911/1915/1917 synthase
MLQARLTNKNNLPPILYEDKDILALDKPCGLLVHDDGRNAIHNAGEPTLADMLLAAYPKMKNVGEPLEVLDPKTKKKIKIYRPGIVHRLDKETSGVIIVAKTKKSFEYFKNAFKEKEVKKLYHALVWGTIKDDDGSVNVPIGRSKRDFRKWLAGRGTRGELREAMTYYRVHKRFELDGEKCTYLHVFPKTGRTHQIRVHMKYLNHPVICDALYGTKDVCPKKVGRLALHAFSLDFKLPSGKEKHIESPLPELFGKALADA